MLTQMKILKLLFNLKQKTQLKSFDRLANCLSQLSERASFCMGENVLLMGKFSGGGLVWGYAHRHTDTAQQRVV